MPSNYMLEDPMQWEISGVYTTNILTNQCGERVKVNCIFKETPFVHLTQVFEHFRLYDMSDSHKCFE